MDDIGTTIRTIVAGKKNVNTKCIAEIEKTIFA